MKKYFSLLFICMMTYFTNGQSISSYVIASAGESAEAGGISVSWTLGELAIETLQDNSETLTLTQGFQQGYFEITSIGEPLSNHFNLRIYPNPAREFIWVDMTSDEIQEVIVVMYNLEGKVVYNKKLTLINGPEQIELNNMMSSQYILRVTDSSGNILQTFKLIKR